MNRSSNMDIKENESFVVQSKFIDFTVYHFVD